MCEQQTVYCEWWCYILGGYVNGHGLYRLSDKRR